MLIAIEVLSTDILNGKEIPLKMVISDGLCKDELDRNIKNRRRILEGNNFNNSFSFV